MDKGANKTPLDQAAWPLACNLALARKMERGRFARRRQAASPRRAPEKSLPQGQVDAVFPAAGGLMDKKGIDT
jgi:hypothetical protein